MRKKVHFSDSSSEDELAHDLESAAERERQKNPHGFRLSSFNGKRKEPESSSKQLFSSSSDDENDGEVLKDSPQKSGIRINKAYAEKYDQVKRQKELHSLTSKYGKHLPSEDSEEEIEEDDDAVLLTSEKELSFAKALYAARHPKAAVNEPFFSSPDEQLAYNTRVFQSEIEKKKKRKQHTLAAEFQRAVVAAADGNLPDDLDTVDNSSGSKRLAPRTAKEKALRDAFLKSAEDVTDFTAHKKTDAEDVDHNDASHSDSPSKEEARRLLEQAFDSAEKENDDEAFIKSYFMNELWRRDNEDEEGLDYKALAEAEEQDLFYDDAEVWEHEFQEKKYRHEENLEEASHIQTFPRPVGEATEGLLRKQDSSRKDARQRRLQRITEARKQQVEELKRLKHLKKQEIENQRALIASVSGLSKKSCGLGNELSDEDEALARLKEVWSEKDFDAPFDPEEFDRKMGQIFNEEYYKKENVDQDEMQFMEAELDGTDDEDREEQLRAVLREPDLFHTESLDEAKKRATSSKDDGLITSIPESASPEFDDTVALLYPSSTLERMQSAVFDERRSPNDRADGNEEMLSKLTRELREKEDAYYHLHYEADGSMPFRYRSVPAEDFTLSVEEILARDDRQLNMIAPMNCYAAYLDKFSNERDRRRIESRSQRGFREIHTERRSRRYGDVSKTVILDDSISEKDGMEIARRLEKRLAEEGASGAPSKRYRIDAPPIKTDIKKIKQHRHADKKK